MPKPQRRAAHPPKAHANPFDTAFKRVTTELTKLEKEATQKQQRLEEVRRQRDQADVWRSLSTTARLTMDQERPRVDLEVSRAEHLLDRIVVDRKTRKREYDSADALMSAAEKDVEAARSALQKAQDAFDRASADVVAAKQQVSGLPGEIRALRQTISDLSQRVDTGLTVKRFDVGTTGSRLRRTVAELKALVPAGVLTARIKALDAATGQLNDATAVLEAAKKAFDVKTQALEVVKNKTHKVGS